MLKSALRVIYHKLQRSIRKLKRQPYRRLVDGEYAKAMKLAVAYIENAAVEGDIAEFGTHGVTATVMARQLWAYNSKRSLHLFDSFEGFPEPTLPADLACPHVRSGAWGKGTSRAGGLAPIQLRRKLSRYLPSPQLWIYQGYYSETLNRMSPNSRFALLVMDCCFYQSHIEALSSLFKRSMVSKGGMILFSDYGANHGAPEFGSRRAWKETMTQFAVEASPAGTYCWGGEKFIVHRYHSSEA